MSEDDQSEKTDELEEKDEPAEEREASPPKSDDLEVLFEDESQKTSVSGEVKEFHPESEKTIIPPEVSKTMDESETPTSAIHGAPSESHVEKPITSVMTETRVTEELPVVKKKSYKQRFKEAFKEAVLAFKDINLRSMSPVAYLVALILVVAFAALQFIKIKFTFPILSFVLPSNPLLIPLSLIVAIFFAITWIAMGLTFAGPFARFLVQNKVAKQLFTKGDVHYIEYVPEEENIVGFGLVIAKTIALIIAWAAMAATLFSVLASLLSLVMSGFDPAGLIVLDPDQRQQLNLPPLDGIFGPLVFIFQIVIIYVLSPLLVTIIIPIPWMLMDARLKAFDSKRSKINWFIGLKVQQRTRNIVSIAAIVGLGSSYAIINRIEVILQMVALILVYMALPSVILSFLYLLLFQSRLREEIVTACGVPLGRTTVELLADSPSQDED